MCIKFRNVVQVTNLVPLIQCNGISFELKLRVAYSNFASTYSGSTCKYVTFSVTVDHSGVISNHSGVWRTGKVRFVAFHNFITLRLLNVDYEKISFVHWQE
jgi:hypothetical protein